MFEGHMWFCSMCFPVYNIICGIFLELSVIQKCDTNQTECDVICDDESDGCDILIMTALCVRYVVTCI